MKKLLLGVLLVILIGITGCSGNKGVTIAVPNDATNEARALLLLHELGIIEVDKTKGLNMTKRDIIDAKGVKIVELKAEQIAPRIKDFSFAVINGNYALNANITDRAIQGASENVNSEAATTFGNVIAVRKGDEQSDKTIALLNALAQPNIKTYIETEFNGLVTPLTLQVEGETKAGNDTKIKVGASSTPHALILEQCKAYLKEHGYLLEIEVFSDYVYPNLSLADKSLDANFFQHLPYLLQFNAERKTELVGVGAIHFEPLALYGGKLSTLAEIKK